MATLTPDEIFARHCWQPGEREQRLAEIAKRRQAYEASGDVEAPAPAPEPVIRKPRPAAAPSTSATAQADWRRWFERRLARALETETQALVAGFADVVGEQLDARDKVIAELRADLAELTARLDRLDVKSSPGPHLRAVSE
jgi:hypothetical protein